MDGKTDGQQERLSKGRGRREKVEQHEHKIEEQVDDLDSALAKQPLRMSKVRSSNPAKRFTNAVLLCNHIQSVSFKALETCHTLKLTLTHLNCTVSFRVNCTIDNKN